jgi:hypothetical protein
MFHSTAVVGINTSAQIDAAIVGKSVFTIRAFAQSQEGTLHFHYLLRENGGFVRDAGSLDEHVEQLQGVGVPASPLVADAIEELAQLTVEPARLSPQAVALRVLLWPIALLLRVTSAVWIVTRVKRDLRRAAASAENAASG